MSNLQNGGAERSLVNLLQLMAYFCELKRNLSLTFI